MQRHRSVHSADPLLVSDMALVSQVISHFVTAPPRLLVCQGLQLPGDRFIRSSLCLVTIYTATEIDHATGLSFTESKFCNCITGQFPSFFYFESFFSIISFSTSCS